MTDLKAPRPVLLTAFPRRGDGDFHGAELHCTWKHENLDVTWCLGLHKVRRKKKKKKVSFLKTATFEGHCRDQQEMFGLEPVLMSQFNHRLTGLSQFNHRFQVNVWQDTMARSSSGIPAAPRDSCKGKSRTLPVVLTTRTVLPVTIPFLEPESREEVWGEIFY